MNQLCRSFGADHTIQIVLLVWLKLRDDEQERFLLLLAQRNFSARSVRKSTRYSSLYVMGLLSLSQMRFRLHKDGMRTPSALEPSHKSRKPPRCSAMTGPRPRALGCRSRCEMHTCRYRFAVYPALRNSVAMVGSSALSPSPLCAHTRLRRVPSRYKHDGARGTARGLVEHGVIEIGACPRRGVQIRRVRGTVEPVRPQKVPSGTGQSGR